MDNQHEKITGYRDLNVDEIDAMNQLKAVEAKALSLIADLTGGEDNDRRALAIARTEIQTGFMWAIRAVARPAQVEFPGDQPMPGEVDKEV